ncbi:MAG TPA: glycerophosphodiester phosphodiesterase family protein, partial [bacterium]|nr:glycerophosphodiester phosphodiesterase family protein [bacterium]
VMPATRRYWLTGPEGCRTAEALAGFLEKIGADGAGCRVHRGIDRRFAAALRKRGKELNVWTVDRADAARRLAAAGVDSISTNRPGPIGEALEAAGLRKARPGGPGDSGG